MVSVAKAGLSAKGVRTGIRRRSSRVRVSCSAELPCELPLTGSIKNKAV